MTRLPVRKYPPSHYVIGNDIVIVHYYRRRRAEFPLAEWRVLYENEVVTGLTRLEAWRLVRSLRNASPEAQRPPAEVPPTPGE